MDKINLDLRENVNNRQNHLMNNLYCDFTHLRYGGVKHILQDFLKDCYLQNRNVEQDFKALHNLDPALGKVLQPLLEQALEKKNFLEAVFKLHEPYPEGKTHHQRWRGRTPHRLPCFNKNQIPSSVSRRKRKKSRIGETSIKIRRTSFFLNSILQFFFSKNKQRQRHIKYLPG